MTASLPILALLAVVGLAACSDDSGSDDGPDDAVTTTAPAGPTVDEVIDCLTDAGLDAVDVSEGGRSRIDIRYPITTTEIELFDSPAEAEENVELMDDFGLDHFTVGSAYVYVAPFDDDSTDRELVSGCLS